MEVGVNIDSPTPINILGRASVINPFAAPDAIVKILHRTTPKAINFDLFTLSASAPINKPIIE